jgi:hypothetical protein
MQYQKHPSPKQNIWMGLHESIMGSHARNLQRLEGNFNF